MNKRKEASELLHLIRNFDAQKQVGVLLMTEAACSFASLKNDALLNKKKTANHSPLSS